MNGELACVMPLEWHARFGVKECQVKAVDPTPCMVSKTLVLLLWPGHTASLLWRCL